MDLGDYLACVPEQVTLPAHVLGLCAQEGESGSAYFAACADHVIYRIVATTPDGQRHRIERYAGRQGISGCLDGHRLKEASFHVSSIGSPLCSFKDDSFLVVDNEHHVIRLVSGSYVSKYAGFGMDGNREGPKLLASFGIITSICYVAGNGIIFTQIQPTSNNSTSIHLINERGLVTTLESTRTDSFWACAAFPGLAFLFGRPPNALESLNIINGKRQTLSSDLKVEPELIRDRLHKDLIHVAFLAHCAVMSGQAITSQSSSSYSSSRMLTDHLVHSSGASLEVPIFAFHKGYHVMSIATSDTIRFYDLSNTNCSSPVTHSIDMSPLLRGGVPEHFRDLHIINEHSQVQFYLHKPIIRCAGYEGDQFAKSLEKSQHPRESMKLFIRLLYTPARLTIQSLPMTLETSKMLCHVYHLHSQASNRSPPIWCLMDELAYRFSRLSPQDLCSALLEVWTTCERNDSLTNILVPLIQVHGTDAFESQASLWVPVMQESPAQVVKLFRRVSSPLYEAPSMSSRPPCLPNDYPHHPPPCIAWCNAMDDSRVPIERVFWELANNTTFESRFRPCVWRLGIRNWKWVLYISEHILYSGWSYFRSLVDDGEVDPEGHFELPSDFPPRLLLVLARSLHGINGKSLECLNFDESLFLLSRGGEFGLDYTQPTTPLLTPLFDHCKSVVFCQPTSSNCIKLILACHELGCQERLDAALKFASQNFQSIRENHPKLPELVAKLPPRLLLFLFVDLLL